MCASILGFQAPLLRGVADHLALTTIQEIARQPSIKEVYRITAHYFDGRACNSVATLRSTLIDGVVLETVYQRALNHKPIVHRIEAERYRVFTEAVKGLSFDRMKDQPDLPEYHSTDLWLIERAAGTFYHSVIIAPNIAHDDYFRLANAVKNGLPEALRMVK